jgi:membrane-anchored glycerophosphoryl diester phosphodiesterase (GDPDase)
VTAEPTWTPAPRGGLIPLHPYGFGTILGKSFSALRGNPRVLLGFAMVVQLVSSLIATAVIGAVGFATFSRLDTVPSYSDDFEVILAGSAFITGAVALIVSLLLAVLGVIVQGIVVGEVAHAALGERATLGMLWRRLRPSLWRLIGYNALIFAAVLVVTAVAVGVVIGLAVVQAHPALTIVLAILLLLGGIVLYAFLGTKLFVVASAIILERTTVTGGIARSWRLTRGRFWATFGVIAIISVVMNTAASVVGMPFSFLGSAFTSVFAPTGDSEVAAVIGGIVMVVASQVVTFVVASITVVVQATSSVLVYIDARMRREGIDLRMQRYLERRDAGERELEDPYAYDPDAVAPVRAPEPWQIPGGVPPYPYGGAPGYPQPGYGDQPGYGQPPAGYPAAPGYGQQQGYGEPVPPQQGAQQQWPQSGPAAGGVPYAQGPYAQGQYPQAPYPQAQHPPAPQPSEPQQPPFTPPQPPAPPAPPQPGQPGSPEGPASPPAPPGRPEAPEQPPTPPEREGKDGWAPPPGSGNDT